MNYAPVTEEQDAAFTELMKANKNFTTQLRQQEEQVSSLQTKICNLTVAAATRTTEVRGTNKGVRQTYTHKKNPEHNDLPILMKRNKTTNINAGHMDMT